MIILIKLFDNYCINSWILVSRHYNVCAREMLYFKLYYIHVVDSSHLRVHVPVAHLRRLAALTRHSQSCLGSARGGIGQYYIHTFFAVPR